MKKLMRVLFAVSLLFILVGCSGPRLTYSKPGLTTNEFNRDKYDCVRQSQTSWKAGGSGAAGGMMIMAAQSDANNKSNQLFRMCMEARGYTAQVETESADDKRDSFKAWAIQWNEVAKASVEICNKKEYQPLFIKSPCKYNEISILHLTDKSMPTEEEKAWLIKLRVEEKTIHLTRNKLLLENPLDKQSQKTKNRISGFDEFEKLEEKADLELFEKNISWGEYNKQRKKLTETFQAEHKQKE